MAIRRISFLSALLLVPATLAAPSATADLPNYNWKVCTIANPYHPATPPCVSEAADGSTIELVGDGTFDTAGAAMGGGTFVHKDPAGLVHGAGKWSATALVSFTPYGDGTPQGVPKQFEGRLALLDVDLFPAGSGVLPGVPERVKATLQIDCLLGSYPADHYEAVRLFVPDEGLNFDKEINGETVFARLS